MGGKHRQVGVHRKQKNKKKSDFALGPQEQQYLQKLEDANNEVNYIYCNFFVIINIMYSSNITCKSKLIMTCNAYLCVSTAYTEVEGERTTEVCISTGGDSLTCICTTAREEKEGERREGKTDRKGQSKGKENFSGERGGENEGEQE